MRSYSHYLRGLDNRANILDYMNLLQKRVLHNDSENIQILKCKYFDIFSTYYKYMCLKLKNLFLKI